MEDILKDFIFNECKDLTFGLKIRFQNPKKKEYTYNMNRGTPKTTLESSTMFRKRFNKYLQAKKLSYMCESTQELHKMLKNIYIVYRNSSGYNNIQYYITKAHYEEVLLPLYKKKYEKFKEACKKSKKSKKSYISKKRTLKPYEKEICKNCKISQRELKRIKKHKCLKIVKTPDEQIDFAKTKVETFKLYSKILSKVLEDTRDKILNSEMVKVIKSFGEREKEKTYLCISHDYNVFFVKEDIYDKIPEKETVYICPVDVNRNEFPILIGQIKDFRKLYLKWKKFDEPDKKQRTPRAAKKYYKELINKLTEELRISPTFVGRYSAKEETETNSNQNENIPSEQSALSIMKEETNQNIQPAQLVLKVVKPQKVIKECIDDDYWKKDIDEIISRKTDDNYDEVLRSLEKYKDNFITNHPLNEKMSQLENLDYDKMSQNEVEELVKQMDQYETELFAIETKICKYYEKFV